MFHLSWNENDNDGHDTTNETMIYFHCLSLVVGIRFFVYWRFDILKSISPNSHIKSSMHEESNQWVKKMWLTEENEFH